MISSRRRFLKAIAAIPAAAAVPTPLIAAAGTPAFGTSIVSITAPIQRQLNDEVHTLTIDELPDHTHSGSWS